MKIWQTTYQIHSIGGAISTIDQERHTLLKL